MERRDSHIELADKLANLDVCIAKGFARADAQNESVVLSIAELKKDQEKIIHVLYGNGKEGIITSVAKIAQKLNLMWAIWATISAAIVTFGIGLAQGWLLK